MCAVRSDGRLVTKRNRYATLRKLNPSIIGTISFLTMTRGKDSDMRNKLGHVMMSAAVSVALSAALLPSSAYARDHGGRGWGGGWGGWGWGVGAGVATGLALDAAWGWPGYYAYPYPYYAEPVTVIQQAPVVVQPAAAAATTASYYYCPNPKGYYPYVQSCQVAWQMVPATPPGAQK